MDTLESNLKKWINIENNIKNINSDLKLLREEKNNLTKELGLIIENNNLHKSTFKIGDNFIKYNTYKQSSPITLKYLEKCFLEYFDNDNDSVQELLTIIKENREIKTVNELKNNKK